MFEAIRKHSKIVMFLLFLLVIPSFVLVGIDSNYFSEKSPVVARVDGHKITQADWDNAHREETDRIRAQSPNVDPKQLDTPKRVMPRWSGWFAIACLPRQRRART